LKSSTSGLVADKKPLVYILVVCMATELAAGNGVRKLSF